MILCDVATKKAHLAALEFAKEVLLLLLSLAKVHA
jgi:hypothetical protein